MVEIGGVPILDHIMNLYSQHGYKDFILALGYLGSVVKDYFVNHELRNSDITVDLAHNKTQYNGDLNRHQIVRMIDTGQASMTGGRLHRLEHVLRPEGTFMLTYGDGLSNVDIKKLVEYHRQHGKFATDLNGVKFGRTELSIPPFEISRRDLEDGQGSKMDRVPDGIEPNPRLLNLALLHHESPLQEQR